MTAADFREHLQLLRDMLTLPLTDVDKLRAVAHLLEVWIGELEAEDPSAMPMAWKVPHRFP